MLSHSSTSLVSPYLYLDCVLGFHSGSTPLVWYFIVVVLCLCGVLRWWCSTCVVLHGGGASPVWCLVVHRGFVVVGVLRSLLPSVCGRLSVALRGFLVSTLFKFRLILFKFV